jgi:hypothetical protein
MLIKGQSSLVRMKAIWFTSPIDSLETYFYSPLGAGAQAHVRRACAPGALVTQRYEALTERVKNV